MALPTFSNHVESDGQGMASPVSLEPMAGTYQVHSLESKSSGSGQNERLKFNEEAFVHNVQARSCVGLEASSGGDNDISIWRKKTPKDANSINADAALKQAIEARAVDANKRTANR